MLRFIVFLLLLAAALYVVFWALDRRGSGGDEQRPAPRGPLGPDDDADFLRDLQRRRHHRPPPPPDPRTPPGAS